MDPQSVAECIARHLTQGWALHRTPAFIDYLLQNFGCEPLEPVRFAGFVVAQMNAGRFFPDYPDRLGPFFERTWLMDDAGFRAISVDEWLSVEGLESNNPLVVYAPSRWPRWLKRATCKPIGLQPYLRVYPSFMFGVMEDKIKYYEQYGVFAGCGKFGKIVVGKGVIIQDVGVEYTSWQGGYKDLS